MQLQYDSIWNDYRKVASRAAVGLRMEMMNPLNYAYIGEKNRQRRLAFLASFLGDTTIRDQSVHKAKFEGPCAAFTFGKIAVRDFAATMITSILEIADSPTKFWTPEQWTQLRRKVEAALTNEDLPEFAD